MTNLDNFCDTLTEYVWEVEKAQEKFGWKDDKLYSEICSSCSGDGCIFCENTGMLLDSLICVKSKYQNK